MKTMFKVEERVYTDCEGRNSEWTVSNQYVETVKEAQAIADTIKADMIHSGDYKIIATTIDEATFTIVNEVIRVFDAYKEAFKENMKGRIAEYEKKIEELEVSKKRCRTEKGIAKKDKEIENYKMYIENINKRI
jgi:hypothetical protein